MLSLPYLSDTGTEFPPVDAALEDPNGLLAVGGQLTPERLVAAYESGIFPWYQEGEPILWWSPNPRCVLYPNEFHAAKSFNKFMNKQSIKVTTDRCFERVIKTCAHIPRASRGTWILDEMVEAYSHLHKLGLAHSVEVWQGESLVGGLYGVCTNGVFSGESMFSLVPNASKVALYTLCLWLIQWQYILIDCQIPNPHLSSLGAVKISRSDYLTVLGRTNRVVKTAWDPQSITQHLGSVSKKPGCAQD